MIGFIRIFALLAGAAIVLGCQGNKDVADPAASGSSAPPAEQAGTVAEEAEQEPEEEPEEDLGSPAAGSSLVQQVVKISQIKTVEQTDAGITMRMHLNLAATVNADSPPEVVSDAMMFATFYLAPRLYGGIDEMDGLHLDYIYNGRTIGDIKLTRASYESLGYSEAMRGVTEQQAKRDVHRKLLSQLPKGAVKIKKKYRP